VTVKEH